MVSLFKRNLFGMEKKVRAEVVEEMKNKFNRAGTLGAENFKRFADYRNQIDRMAAEFFADANKQHSKEIKAMAEKALEVGDGKEETGKNMRFPVGGQKG